MLTVAGKREFTGGKVSEKISIERKPTGGFPEKQLLVSGESRAELPGEGRGSLAPWTCLLRREEALRYPERENLTVGEVFVLDCRGELAPQSLQALSFPQASRSGRGESKEEKREDEKKEKNWRLELPQGKERALVLLGVESPPLGRSQALGGSSGGSVDPVPQGHRRDSLDHIQLRVTGYLPGKHSLSQVILTDGSYRYGFEPLGLVFDSVLESSQARAYGPVAPQSIALPLWLWLLALGLVLGVLFPGIQKIRRRLQRRRILSELSKYSTALSPQNQFHKEVRELMGKTPLDSQLSRDQVGEFVGTLNKCFRRFLFREFQVPALEWSSKAVMKELRSRYGKNLPGGNLGPGPATGTSLVAGKNTSINGGINTGLDTLQLNLRELDGALARVEEVDSMGCQQLLEMSRKAVQSLVQTPNVPFPGAQPPGTRSSGVQVPGLGGGWP